MSNVNSPPGSSGATSIPNQVSPIHPQTAQITPSPLDSQSNAIPPNPPMTAPDTLSNPSHKDSHVAYTYASSPRPPPAPPSHPSLVPPYLHRLSRLLTFLLAIGGSAALISTLFILPLLQSTFAARTALVKAQSERMEVFLGRLRSMRALRMYGPRSHNARDGRSVGPDGQVVDDTASQRRSEEEEVEQAGDEEKALIRSSSVSTPSAPPALLSLPALTTLITALRTLKSLRSNTSTTRTSLLSTIEAYTSALHRQLWNPAPGHSAYGFGRGSGRGVGLGSLDRQLALTGGRGKGKGPWDDARAGEGGGGGVVLEDVVDRREEWDAVRREIRGVKGLLLGRRTVARPMPT